MFQEVKNQGKEIEDTYGRYTKKNDSTEIWK